MTFIKKKEDFICEHCGFSVAGNGYTNHCPQCLWSKHVDIDPGDRAATCGGLMKPTAVATQGDTFILTHTCEVCGHQKKNKIAPDDSFDALMAIQTT